MVNNSSRPSETSNKQERSFPPSQPPKFFSFSNGKAVPIQKTDLFKGKTFHLRCDFPDAYQAQLIKDIEALGGCLNAPNAWTADYVINNPPENDKQWQNELARRLKAQTGQRPPIQRPYYWIYACHHAGRILSEDEIADRPVFTRWTHLNRRPVPLLIYITVNLPRFGDEVDESDKKETNPQLRPLREVEATVETHGGFRSATRSDADVLVLNLDTKAGAKYKAEAKPDQVIWTREELEEHAEKGMTLDLGKDMQPREIVVARTNAGPTSTGITARRTSRKEFTPEDDDLVIRYIAAYDPEKKSMTSKSFYTQMMNSTNKRVTSWVHRHTAESWRERVKKRVAPFKLRVEAYLHDKVDKSLCTREERETGSIPAGLRSEALAATASTSHRSRSDAPGVAAPAVHAMPRERGNGDTVGKSTSKVEGSRKRSRLEDPEFERDTSEVSAKKAKTIRKGAMPIDEELRNSPSPEMEAGPSRVDSDGASRRRLRPRRSAEGDVFDDPQFTGLKETSPVKQKFAETRQATRTAEARPVLAPASSPPAEDLDVDNGVVKLELIMDEVIDEDSVAEGEPDTDDAELEQDLLEHIHRQEGSAKNSRSAEISQEAATSGRYATQDPGARSGHTKSQVPNTQDVILDATDIVAHPPASTRTRLHRSTPESSSSSTIRRTMSRAAAQALHVPATETSTQSGPLLGGTVPETRGIVQASVLQITTVNEIKTVQPRSGDIIQSETGTDAQERARIRAQSDEEKRQELRRIIVGLTEEYDLNYKAMHRLIEECRKRYSHVNQALLRGMIEQALAASAEADGDVEAMAM